MADAAPDWQARAAQKRTQRDAALPTEWLLSSIPDDRLNVIDLPKESGILSARELEITELDAPELLKSVAERTYTALEVTIAFCKRATVAQQAVNCLTEILFDSAIDQAKGLDAHLEQTGKVLGPLHGLPVSLKDQCQIKGVECTMGFVSWIGEISKEDAVIVKMLREAGAVFHARTNVPQTLQRTETDNWIFGRTFNPHNRSLTAGGSSGGEGALLAMRGSLMGIGSAALPADRTHTEQPTWVALRAYLTEAAAACNGLYALKPGTGRTPCRGLKDFASGLGSIETVVSPLSTSLDGLIAIYQAIVEVGPHELDPAVIELPWRQDQFELKHLDGGQRLCFGIIRDDHVFHCSPPAARVLAETVGALERAGHEVIELDEAAPLHAEIDALQICFNNPTRQEFDAITAESAEPVFRQTWIVDRSATAYDVMLTNRRRDDLRARYLALWRATARRTSTGRPMDAILMPTLPLPAWPHDNTFSPTYTECWNLLDYPVVALPVGQVDQTLDQAGLPPSEFYANDEDRSVWESYRPERHLDAPLSVQIVSRRHREEELLGIARIVDATVSPMRV